MEAIIEAKRYNTETATLLADNRYFDGSNWERSGTNDYLYKTKKGNFFVHSTSQWQGSSPAIKPVSPEEAAVLYERLREQRVPFVEAFGYEPEEA